MCKWDKEYATQYLEEVNFLKDKGILSVFVKTTEDGVRIYKYTKNKELFSELAEFYNK